VIHRKANDAFDSLRFSREIFSIDELVDKIKGEENRPTLLIDFLEDGKQAMLKRVGVDITKQLITSMVEVLNTCRNFLQERLTSRTI